MPERRSLEGNNLRYYIFLFNRILLFNIFQVSWRPRYNYWYCPDIELLFNVRVISIDITRTLKYYSMCGWYQLILPGEWKFSQRYVRIIFSYWTIISMKHVLNKKDVACRIVDISLSIKNTQFHAKFLNFFRSSVLLIE